MMEMKSSQSKIVERFKLFEFGKVQSLCDWRGSALLGACSTNAMEKINMKAWRKD